MFLRLLHCMSSMKLFLFCLFFSFCGCTIRMNTLLGIYFNLKSFMYSSK